MELLKRFNFPENIQLEYGGMQGCVASEIAVRMAEKWEDFVVEQIVAEAIYMGISDLTVLNKPAIMDALRKQIPIKQRIDNDDWRCCPRCNETFFLVNAFNKRNKYCGNCGQALDWGEQDGKL